MRIMSSLFDIDLKYKTLKSKYEVDKQLNLCYKLERQILLSVIMT